MYLWFTQNGNALREDDIKSENQAMEEKLGPNTMKVDMPGP